MNLSDQKNINLLNLMDQILLSNIIKQLHWIESPKVFKGFEFFFNCHKNISQDILSFLHLKFCEATSNRTNILQIFSL